MSAAVGTAHADVVVGGRGYEAASQPHKAAPLPEPTRTCRVVAGPRTEHPGRVPFALSQLWRFVGVPLTIVHAPRGGADVHAATWAAQHSFAGIGVEKLNPATPPDVLLLFGLANHPAMRAVLPVARRCGLEVIDGDQVGEFR